MIKRKATDLIIVHCSATAPGIHVDRDVIEDWHRQRGWDGIGYHFVVLRTGIIQAGRPIEVIGAHTSGFNSTSIGICLVGGVDRDGKPEDNFTEFQLKEARKLIEGLLLDFPRARVAAHRDFTFAKDCPCILGQRWLALSAPLPQSGS